MLPNCGVACCELDFTRGLRMITDVRLLLAAPTPTGDHRPVAPALTLALALTLTLTLTLALAQALTLTLTLTIPLPLSSEAARVPSPAAARELRAGK